MYMQEKKNQEYRPNVECPPSSIPYLSSPEPPMGISLWAGLPEIAYAFVNVYEYPCTLFDFTL